MISSRRHPSGAAPAGGGGCRFAGRSGRANRRADGPPARAHPATAAGRERADTRRSALGPAAAPPRTTRGVRAGAASGASLSVSRGADRGSASRHVDLGETRAGGRAWTRRLGGDPVVRRDSELVTYPGCQSTFFAWAGWRLISLISRVIRRCGILRALLRLFLVSPWRRAVWSRQTGPF